MNKQLLFDIGLLLIILLSFAILNPTIAAIIACLVAIEYMRVTNRKEMLWYLLIALITASVWMIFTYKNYSYTAAWMPLGLPLFPLFSWTIGLFGLRFAMSYIRTKPFNQIIIATILYWTFLIGFETIAYHVLNIHNTAATQYPGLAFCNCIHAAPWMQASYLLLGPIYLILCAAFDRIRHKNDTAKKMNNLNRLSNKNIKIRNHG